MNSFFFFFFFLSLNCRWLKNLMETDSIKNWRNYVEEKEVELVKRRAAGCGPSKKVLFLSLSFSLFSSPSLPLSSLPSLFLLFPLLPPQNINIIGVWEFY